jgi:hypothetical protein
MTMGDQYTMNTYLSRPDLEALPPSHSALESMAWITQASPNIRHLPLYEKSDKSLRPILWKQESVFKDRVIHML